jgi:hypothetical protein
MIENKIIELDINIINNFILIEETVNNFEIIKDIYHNGLKKYRFDIRYGIYKFIIFLPNEEIDIILEISFN